MKTKDFFGKLFSKYLLGHLAAMALTIVGLCVGVKYGLDFYTHHGEGIPVPNIRGMAYDKAKALVEGNGLLLVVTDSGYNKQLPADCILMQTPGYGAKVKEGHTVYVTVNSPSSPTVTIPDIIDNCSSREAMAKLRALGFKLGEPRMVTGEKDWVYGIESRGRRVANGDVVSVEAPLTLLIGNGQYDEDNVDIDYSEPTYGDDENFDADAPDDFEEMGDPASAEHDAPTAAE